jgi:hypothetical protein
VHLEHFMPEATDRARLRDAQTDGKTALAFVARGRNHQHKQLF